MAVPSAAAYLRNLYRMKRECTAQMEEAERRGDLREVAEFREYVERVESMIEMKGGNPDARAYRVITPPPAKTRGT